MVLGWFLGRGVSYWREGEEEREWGGRRRGRRGREREGAGGREV